MKKLTNILLLVTMFFVSCINDDENLLNYTEFDVALSAAKNAADINKEGEGGGDLVVGSTSILNEQIAIYESYRVTAINQGTLDNAVAKLNEATEVYLASTIQIDFNVLTDNIASAQVLLDSAIEGILSGQYAVGSKAVFEAAIDATQLVADDGNATQSVINSANTTLNSAITTFEAGKVAPLDATAINEAMASAQVLHDGATEGVEIGNYASGSKAILQTAIDAAKAVVDDTLVTQVMIDAAKVTFDAAVVTFEAGRVFGADRDLTTLTATISTAETLHDSAIEGIDLGNYPVGEKAVLQAVIDAAQAIVSDLSTNQGHVDSSNTTLEAAIVTFKATQLVLNVLNFEGTDFVETTGFKGVSGGAQRTMEAWIKTASTTDATGIIMSWGENSPAMKWDMRVTGAGNLRIEYNGGSVFGSKIVNDNVWHHVAVVVPADGGPLSNTVVYVDGVLDTGNASGSSIIDTSSALDFWIGRSTGQPDRYFVGLISDVRIWDVARSASEIAASKDSRLTGTESGLVGYWKLNDGDGTSASDSVSSGHTGVLGGSEGAIAEPNWFGVTSGLPFGN